MEALLSETQHALAILYGPAAASASRSDRRKAEKGLLALRKANPGAAMQVCTRAARLQRSCIHSRNGSDNDALVSVKHPETTWADALLTLIQGAADACRAKPVLTSSR